MAQGNSLYFLKQVRQDQKKRIQHIRERVSEIKDPRRTSHGNLRHKLEDLILIGLLSTLCLGEDFAGMEEFGEERAEWLRGFLERPNGIPDSDTFRRVFERLNPDELLKCLSDGLDEKRDPGPVINTDDKTIRGSGNEAPKAYHVVSA